MPITGYTKDTEKSEKRKLVLPTFRSPEKSHKSLHVPFGFLLYTHSHTQLLACDIETALY